MTIPELKGPGWPYADRRASAGLAAGAVAARGMYDRRMKATPSPLSLLDEFIRMAQEPVDPNAPTVPDDIAARWNDEALTSAVVAATPGAAERMRVAVDAEQERVREWVKAIEAVPPRQRPMSAQQLRVLKRSLEAVKRSR